MTDTNSFSSLMALVDNHLSKTNLQGSRSEEGGPPSSGIQIPSLHGPGSFSESRLSYSPGQRLPIPSLNLSESPIANVLAEQVANMLKAKEKRQKEEEEKLKLEEEMLKLKLHEEDDCDDLVIDLMEALKTPYVPGPPMPRQEVLSSSSSFESLFEPKFIDCEVDPLDVQKSAYKEPLLSCKTDMSYILKQKVPQGKCSNFGKVLVSRYRPIAAPYLKEKVNSAIVKFDFRSPSPCDVIKYKLKKPYMYQQEVPSHFGL